MSAAKPTSSRTVAERLGLAAATAGLTSCIGGGAVDPAPEPLQCDLIAAGTNLLPTAALQGTTLTITLSPDGVWVGEGEWTGVEVVNVVGGALTSVSPTTGNYGSTAITIVIELESAQTTSGTFRLQGTARGWDGNAECAVARDFSFTVAGAEVQVAVAETLPLGTRQQASILVVRHSGVEVELRANLHGDGRAEWTVSDGELLDVNGASARWRLPEQPGLYQVELAVDYAERGLAFDTLPLEVG